MMKRFADWVSSWVTTLDIMINDRRLYRELRKTYDPGEFTSLSEFVEVDRPAPKLSRLIRDDEFNWDGDDAPKH
ncbi:MAG: hypothetical protein ACREHG_08015 [Candidatus Saccharimonadales bacterium]